jgi:hypothetical protein
MDQMRTQNHKGPTCSLFWRRSVVGLVIVLAWQVELVDAQTPPPATSTPQTPPPATSTPQTPPATNAPKPLTPPPAPTTDSRSPYSIDPKASNAVSLTIQYKLERSTNTVSYVAPAEKAQGFKVTYNGGESAPEWIQIKFTYKINGLEGTYEADGYFAYDPKIGGYTLDTALTGLINAIFVDETEQLPKDFAPKLRLAVNDIAVTIIPMKLTVGLDGKVLAVATGASKGILTSNKLTLTLVQVLGTQPTKGVPKAAAPKAAAGKAATPKGGAPGAGGVNPPAPADGGAGGAGNDPA